MKRSLAAELACLNESMFLCYFIFHLVFNICDLHSCFFKILLNNLNGSMLAHFLFNAFSTSREARDEFCLTHDCENPCEHSSSSYLLPKSGIGLHFLGLVCVVVGGGEPPFDSVFRFCSGFFSSKFIGRPRLQINQGVWTSLEA